MPRKLSRRGRPKDTLRGRTPTRVEHLRARPRRGASALLYACLALATLLPAIAVGAFPPKSQLGANYPSLLGYVLIASPQIADPRFAHTVILIVRHDKDGALGLTINRPAGERTLASMLDSLGDNNPSAQGTIQLYAGGPMQPEAVFVVHTSEYRRRETMAVSDSLAVTSSLEIVRDISNNKGPNKSLLVLGYAGWAPRQLEAERARDDWFIAPAEAKLIFDVRREDVWEEALARRVREL